MGKLLTRTSQALIDMGVLALAFWLAFLIRFDGLIPLQMLKRLMFTLPYVVAWQYFLMVGLGIPRFSWRYVSLREAKAILATMGVAACFLLAARLVSAAVVSDFVYAQYALLPIGVILIDFVLSFLGVTGVRVLRRQWADYAARTRWGSAAEDAVPTLLVGAGRGGAMVAQEIVRRPDLGIRPAGFLDDDPSKTGTVIHGVPVLGPTGDLAAWCQRTKARQVLITITNSPGPVIRRVIDLCEQAGVSAKIIPRFHELVGGKINFSRIRKVEIEDLLGRPPVHLDMEDISKVLQGQVVLVSGAGGSIGSELCRQVCRFGAAKVVLVERAENSLFLIHQDLQEHFPEVRVVPCAADILNRVRMEHILRTHRPAVLFHAAAHKHVPMMELNPDEAIRNNVFGTQTLADAARTCGVGTFVMISTDKAVHPSSVMGLSKRIAELYVQALSRDRATRFITVRFGNVLDSAGSVIPIFKKQIAQGGPVTVTHPDMERYFMTIPEACQLVLQAAGMGQGGEIFILDMGQPVKIVDLARDLIRLSGFQPGEDIKIQFTAIRPGEKLTEELAAAAEDAGKTRHPKILAVRNRPQVPDEIQRKMAQLQEELERGDYTRLLAKLREIVPEYQSRQPPQKRHVPV